MAVLSLVACKKHEAILENEDPFYMKMEDGCPPKHSEKYQNEKQVCIIKREDLLCEKMMLNAKSANIDKIFKNNKWSSPDHEETSQYSFDKRGIFTILEGGPSRIEKDYEIIGQGKIYKENTGWVYEQTCKPGKCEDLKFSIEYISCDASFHPSDRDYHLSVTIGNRHYDFLEPNNKEKHVSLEYDGIIKPQIRNGFELYLVPPPVK